MLSLGWGTSRGNIHRRRPETADSLADEAVALVAKWTRAARALTSSRETLVLRRLHDLVDDEEGVAFAMSFVDRVIRPESDRAAVGQLRGLVNTADLPTFLSPLDRCLLRAGARLGGLVPSLVVPLARYRMRQLVGHLVMNADKKSLTRQLGARKSEGYRLNVNPLGEAVLGHAEAQRRRATAIELLARTDVDYVSVKVSAMAAQLNLWSFDHSVTRVVENLRPLFTAAAASSPPAFVNLDMEAYRDLELTVAAFTILLSEPEFHGMDAGIVLQAYLPEAFGTLERLVDWAEQRYQRQIEGQPGGKTKIRLVKGANLAMERVDAAMHGWTQAPYLTKHETDANYKRCLDWVLTPKRMAGVRIGVASHNLFDVAWAYLLSMERGVAHQVEFEMLEGMAPGFARVVRDRGGQLLPYIPVVKADDFDAAIAYLLRRLEENASDHNFIRSMFDLEPGTESFAKEESKFRASLTARHDISVVPRRTQDRRVNDPLHPRAVIRGETFVNEPDTDPTLKPNRQWMIEVIHRPFSGPQSAIIRDPVVIDRVLERIRVAARTWASKPPEKRRVVLYRVAEALARRRGDLISAMVHEGRKTVTEADTEVSEAVDFARWYGDQARELHSPFARFEPLGVIVVAPPWNFPVAIPAGGVLAALAAGNAVVLKPAPQTPRCAEIVAECCWSMGVPKDIFAFVRTPDDEVGRHLITHPDINAVILTGAYETAERFRSWRPELPILAETSGKNALVITENADFDDAVADLVHSAFGHSGQKCSAASLGILVGSVARSKRFQRQLVDHVTSLDVGRPEVLSTVVGPVVEPPQGKLLRALTELEPGEQWLIQPRCLTDDLWTPGVKLGVAPGSWFHQTECFGPVLGLMEAKDLAQALVYQNDVAFGLTGGLHSLDPAEIDYWLERVEVGNAYVNRSITGAIVRRQPFGGWKRSSIGPGFKAGGPNYLSQLGRWLPTPRGDTSQFLSNAAASDQRWWSGEFGKERDETSLFCEANIFRYRPVSAIGLIGADADPVGGQRVRTAAELIGVPVVERPTPRETAQKVAEDGGKCIRLLDPSLKDEVRVFAHPLGLHIADDAVTADGRIELLNLLREQTISRTLHRHGNLL